MKTPIVEEEDRLRAALATVTAERDRLLERERHFASVLSVADGGKYRSDWDGAISRVLKELDEAREKSRVLADRAQVYILERDRARTESEAALDEAICLAEEAVHLEALRDNADRDRDAALSNWKRCAADLATETERANRAEERAERMGREWSAKCESSARKEANLRAQIERAESAESRVRSLEEGRGQTLAEVDRMLGRVVAGKVCGLEGLALSGPERDDWIVRTTTRKTISLVREQLRLLSPAAPEVPHE